MGLPGLFLNKSAAMKIMISCTITIVHTRNVLHPLAVANHSI